MLTIILSAIDGKPRRLETCDGRNNG